MIDNQKEVNTPITAFVDASNVHNFGDTSAQHRDDWFDFRLEHETTAAIGVETSDGLTPGLGSSRGDITADDSIFFVVIDSISSEDHGLRPQDDASTVCTYFPAGIVAEDMQIYGNLGPLGSGNGVLTPLASRESAQQEAETTDPANTFGISTFLADGETFGL